MTLPYRAWMINMDIAALGNVAASSSANMSRKVNEGRTLQFDADFACYEVADMDKPAAENFKNLLDLIHMKRVMAGAEFVNCFVTMGYKSGRETMATVKVYQANRDPDAPIKVRVRELRDILANYESHNVKVIVGHFFEADDLMCRYQTAAIANGELEKSVIMSGDKDLWMVQGYHACPKTGRLWLVDGYGKTEYREVGNVKPKLVGEGTSWFWHQMIMGDKADDIPGLEKIANMTLDHYQPLKTGRPRPSGSSLCGEAKAVAILKGVTTDKAAARNVYMAYENYYRVGAVYKFIEQAYLLWMQRDDNQWDVLEFLADSGLRVQPCKEQIRAVEEFNKLRAGRI